jgi:hypothetical protein
MSGFTKEKSGLRFDFPQFFGTRHFSPRFTNVVRTPMGDAKDRMISVLQAVSVVRCEL